MKLTKKELAALAMHEIMSREQTKYRERVEEQNKISSMSDESLKALVDGIPTLESGGAE